MREMLLNTRVTGGGGRDVPSGQNGMSEGYSLKKSCSFYWSHLISHLEQKFDK